MNLSLFAVLDNLGANLAAALQNCRDNSLAFGSAPCDLFSPFVSVHVPCLAADEGFIRLDFAGKLIAESFIQGKPQTVIHEPCCFLGNPEVAGRLTGANAVLAVDH